MTLMAYRAQAQWLRALRGQTCVRAETGAYAWSLLLNFGELAAADADGYQEPTYGLVVECPWRLEDQTRVLAGSRGESETTDDALQVCVGKQLERISIYQPSFMFQARFSDGLLLWAFPDDVRSYALSSEYPKSPWYVAGRAVSGGWEG